MALLGAKSKVKRVQIEATVIRADGTIERLGIVSDSAWRWRLRPLRLISAMKIKSANARMQPEGVGR